MVLYLDNNNIFKRKRGRETFMFMVISGVLMSLLRNKHNYPKFLNFWFYHPRRQSLVIEETDFYQPETKICNHHEDCQMYVFNVSAFYFFLGSSNFQ